MLTWDGPTPTLIGGSLKVAAEEAEDLWYGTFAIEPFKSNRDAFNIWYLDVPAQDRWGWAHNGIEPPVTHPSCAADKETADEYFGDLIGVVDPAYDDVYIADLARFGIEADPTEMANGRAALTVRYVPDGCYGPAGTAFQTTTDGLMWGSGTLPVMGAANRR